MLSISFQSSARRLAMYVGVESGRIGYTGPLSVKRLGGIQLSPRTGEQAPGRPSHFAMARLAKPPVPVSPEIARYRATRYPAHALSQSPEIEATRASP